jgi:arabinose-5-phosphate isomerase
MKVREVMRQGEELPLVPAGTRITDVLIAMSRTKGRPGAAILVHGDGRLAGLFTDGDLRRLLEAGGITRLEDPVDEVMTRKPFVIHPEQLLEEAERLLRETKKDQVPVVDDDGRPVGLLDVQDLLTARA